MASIKDGIYTDITSDYYHSVEGTYSSSQLKDLDDPEYFYKKYISKEVSRESIPAFSIGTFFHTMVLEPHLLDEECAVFEGKVRSGKVWESFQAANAGKTIITAKERDTVQALASAVKNSKIAEEYLSGGSPEVSAFKTVYVFKNRIFTAINGGLFILDMVEGWIPFTGKLDINKAVHITLKVRADYLNKDKGFCSDLKSTTGNCKDAKEVRKKVFDMNYELSASLYLDIFTASGIYLDTFVWIFASKDYLNSSTYIASPDTTTIGRVKWSNAVVTLAKGISCNWKFPEELKFITPPPWELENLPQRAQSL